MGRQSEGMRLEELLASLPAEWGSQSKLGDHYQ
jgi:hypothetical protein